MATFLIVLVFIIKVLLSLSLGIFLDNQMYFLQHIKECLEFFFLDCSPDRLVEAFHAGLGNVFFLDAERRQEDAHRALVFGILLAVHKAVLLQFFDEAGEAAGLHSEERSDFGSRRTFFTADVEQGEAHGHGDAVLVGERAKHARNGQPRHLDIESDVLLGEDGILLIGDQR